MINLVHKAKNNIGPPPIWIMRQAGRYLPEYLEIRKTEKNFLKLCYDVEKVSKITTQPLERFKLDAAIIFSDILVLPHALGVEIEFKEKIGPISKEITTEKQLLALGKDKNKLKNLNNVYEAIAKVRLKLEKNLSLIGFAGSPWTVLTYLLDNKLTRKNFENSKKLIWQNKTFIKNLLNLLIEHTIDHLDNQVAAGADIVKLFDSWAGVLSEEDFDEYIIEPTKKIITALKTKHPNIHIIGFPKGSGFGYEKYIKLTGVDIIAVDQFICLEKMKEWQSKIIVQGNLDPVVLLTNKEVIKKKIDVIFENLNRKNYIFNLGHGILPNTPIENVEFLIKYIHEKW